MRYSVRHQTLYRFSDPVALEPHTVRLCPRGAAQRVLRFDISFEPNPIALCEQLDEFGNTVHRAWFEGMHDELRIETKLRAEALLSNPFAFVPEPQRLSTGDGDPAARELAEDLRREAGDEALPFVVALNSWLFANIGHEVRLTGSARPVAETLRLRTGACRDVTRVFQDVCAAVGLRSRFVSGYQAELEPGEREPHMHAWAEVWLDGGGWVGFDPTHGLAANDHLLALAAAPSPDEAAPISGTYRSNSATANLSHKLWIRTTRTP